MDKWTKKNGNFPSLHQTDQITNDILCILSMWKSSYVFSVTQLTSGLMIWTYCVTHKNRTIKTIYQKFIIFFFFFIENSKCVYKTGFKVYDFIHIVECHSAFWISIKSFQSNWSRFSPNRASILFHELMLLLVVILLKRKVLRKGMSILNKWWPDFIGDNQAPLKIIKNKKVTWLRTCFCTQIDFFSYKTLKTLGEKNFVGNTKQWFFF